MILSQDMSSSTIVTQTPPLVGIAVSLIPKSEEAAETLGTFHDSEIMTSSDVEAWNEAQLIPSVPLDSEVAYDSLSPSVASVDAGGYVSRIADGVAKIRCRMNDGTTIKRIDVTSSGGQAISEFVGYTEGTASELLASAILDLMTPGTTLPFFTSYNLSASSFTTSATCWAKDIIGSMAVAANIFGSWTTANRGAPITPLHHVGARHWQVTSPTAGYGYVIGTKIRYRGVSGTVYERTVVGVAHWGDIVIATLNTALPADVVPRKIVGDWLLQSRVDSGSGATYYAGGVALFVDQFFNCKAMVIGNPLSLERVATEDVTIDGDSHANAIPLMNAAGQTYATDFIGDKIGYFGQGVPGDSGSEVDVIIDGEPALLFCLYGPVTGPPLLNNNGALVNSLIAEADVNAGVSTGLTVTIAPDPSA